MEITKPSARVCVVGAGSSGLTAAKSLYERGIPFDCYEKGSGVGGIWRYENDSGLSPAYRSLHINTSRRRTGFIDYPMPEHYPDFPHHSLMLRYFEDFTNHFGFRDKILFQHSIVRIEPQSDGVFVVTSKDSRGQVHHREYTAVIIANGHHWNPKFPSFPGVFTNTTIHAHQYRTPEPMAGRRVLVVGMGNSGCDIACECSRVADRVFLSTRRGAHIIPKYMFGRPLDRVVPRWIWAYAPFRLFQWAFERGLRISRGRLRDFGLPEPEHRILEEHPTISSDLLHLIGHGDISIKPNVKELAGGEVLFEDGSRETIDVIIYATGYHITIPFLDRSILDADHNEVRLYKRVVHPQVPGLYFVGLVQPWGSMFRLAEEQGKWVADLLEGKCGLPSIPAMLQDIDREQKKVQRRYTRTARHTIQVDFYPYLAALRRERRRRVVGKRIAVSGRAASQQRVA